MKRFSVFLTVTMLTIGFVYANGGSEGAAADRTAGILEMPWDDIIAAAQEEGRVVWYHWYLQDSFREIVKDFENQYGIEVVIPDGDNEGNFDKFLAERNRKVGDIDVLSTPGDVPNRLDMAEFYMGPITDILPDGSKLRTKIEGGDTRGYAAAFWGNQTGLAYDPLRIDPSELPQTVKGLEEYMAANPKKFGFNYENGGSGPAFIQSVSRTLLPEVNFIDGSDEPDKIAKLSKAWDWFSARADQYVITGGNADSLTRLNDGELVIVPAWEDHLAGLQTKNEIDDRIEFYIPEFGMQGGGNVIGIPANAAHPAAALLLVSWITSAETQTRFNTELGSAPQHPDADSSRALVPMAQREYSIDVVPSPFRQALMLDFIDKVILD